MFMLLQNNSNQVSITVLHASEKPSNRDAKWERFTAVADLLVNESKLPGPQDVIEKLSMIEAIVIGTVALSVVRWSQHSHLVTIDWVVAEEILHFFCDLHKFNITGFVNLSASDA